MKTVLVTGSNGQLGESIKSLKSFNPKVNFIFANRIDLDITESTELESFFNKNTIDWCVNCAAYTQVDLAEKETDKAFSINAQGSKNLAEVCNKNKTKLIHISTDFVFDGNGNKPYTEDNKTNPINVYGLSKLQGEIEIRKALKEHVIIRTSWLYSEHGKNFLKTMLRLSETKNEISVVNDQIGSPTYAGDLAEIIMLIVEKDIEDYGLYHFCNKGETSWHGFAKEIFRLTESNIDVKPILSSDFKTEAKRPSYSVMCTNKIENILGLNIENWKISLTKALSKING